MSPSERTETDFGGRMRRARESRGISLRQIAEKTKLSVAAMEALERNDISRLPGGIFSRAFVRNYASEIGMDPESTVREFMSHFPHDSVTDGSPHHRLVEDLGFDTRRRAAIAALIGTALVIVIAAGYFLVPLLSRLGR